MSKAKKPAAKIEEVVRSTSAKKIVDSTVALQKLAMKYSSARANRQKVMSAAAKVKY